MEKILLLEPNYSCKYPPLGLMKIASYHKYIRDDFVWFAKGELPNSVSNIVKSKIEKSFYYTNKYSENERDEYLNIVDAIIDGNKWDRVYIATLFTYEWSEVINAIRYAKTLVPADKIYAGGVMATLMESELAGETSINVCTGLLTSSDMLGYTDNYNIDAITPDYSILDMVEYDYPVNNAYFTYMTRGCGMNCDFCAVQKIEPNYNPYISISNQINEIDRLYGTRKDLLLMDNNVLKSKFFDQIIDELIDLGFEKDATINSNKTNRPIRRYIDFNQGLDGNFINERKAKLLGKIALRPVRVAFDHIEDKDSYFKAINHLVKDGGLKYLSNYILYNGDAFSGKGKHYKADTPSDLYNRLRLNVDYKDEFNESLEENEEKLKLFCFPMRYRPLNVKSRGNKINSYDEDSHDYIGPNWCLRHLRAIQTMLRPTSGKGVTSLSFFNASFGDTLNEFLYVINMPERYIETRGNPLKIKNISPEEFIVKKYEYDKYNILRNEWRNLFDSLYEYEKIGFLDLIKDNEIIVDEVIRTKSRNMLKLIVHYYSGYSILKFLDSLYVQAEEDMLVAIVSYIINECPTILENLIDHFVAKKYTSTQLEQLIRFFGTNGERLVLDKVVTAELGDKELKLLCTYNNPRINYKRLYLVKWCKKLDLIAGDEYSAITNQIRYDHEQFVITCNHLVNRLFNELDNNQVINENYQLVNEIKGEIIVQMSLFEHEQK